ncbi:MAG TPA: TonB family protein [Myxococcaceae bacterium]|nr:TonB family protein [Myxococcaceae bacterium]
MSTPPPLPPQPEDSPVQRAGDFVRRNALQLGLGAVLVSGAAYGVRWIVLNRESPPPRKVMQFSVVTVQPRPPEKPPPPPPPVPQPRVEEETTRVNLKPQDLLPPDEPRPASPPAGPLALATEGEGPGDAFNLAGNPGGRGLLSGGGLGDGSGGLGGGGGNPFGWYYAQVADELGDALRRDRRITSASLRVELRLWTDPSGRVSKVQLLRSTGDAAVDQAIQSIVGLRLRQPPPPGSPMPMVLRVTARRPT